MEILEGTVVYVLFIFHNSHWSFSVSYKVCCFQFCSVMFIHYQNYLSFFFFLRGGNSLLEPFKNEKQTPKRCFTGLHIKSSYETTVDKSFPPALPTPSSQ